MRAQFDEPYSAPMTQRAFAWLACLSVLLLLVDGTCTPAMAEEEEEEEQADAEVDLAQFLEGFAPLAHHGEWTRSEVKESPGTAFQNIPKEAQQGLQEVLGLEFAGPRMGPLKQMTFFAARFETSAQAAAYLAAYHKVLLDQREVSQEQWRHPAARPYGGMWMFDVSKGAGKDGALDGYAIDTALEVFGSSMRATAQYLHVGRLYVCQTFANCSHVSRESQDAFIAYALERLTNPTHDPPPSPDMRIPTREVVFVLRASDGESLASADASVRAVSSDGAGPATHLGKRGTMTLPAGPVKIRIGNALGKDGRLRQLLGEDVIVPIHASARATRPRRSVEPVGSGQAGGGGS